MLFGGVALNVLGRALFDATGHAVSLMIPGTIELSRNALMALVLASLPHAAETGMARVWRPSAGHADADPGTLGLALRRFAPVAVLFGMVMGGLYGGFFTPTEAGGAGAAPALVFALWRGLRRPGLIAAPRETVQVSATIFIVLIGAEVFGFLLSVSQIPFAMAETIREAGWAPWRPMLAIVVFYLVPGCFMASPAMIRLAILIAYPAIALTLPLLFG